MQSSSPSKWAEVLPLLTEENAKEVNKNGGSVLLGFTVSRLAQELRLARAGDTREDGEDEETIGNALREAVVLLLNDGATFTHRTNDGELVYLLPGPNVRARVENAVASSSRRERLRLFWRDRAWPAIVLSVKLFIGLFLVASLLLLALAAIALLAAAKGRGGNGGGGSFFNHRHHHHHGGWWCPIRFWYLPWPVQAGGGGAAAAAAGRRATTAENGEGMSFAEAVFSFIFGDGPSESREEAQVAALRSFIQANEDKRLKAWQFAPFLLEPPPLPESVSNAPPELVEERFMARIVWLFRGTPVASDDGKLAYEFPRLSKPQPSKQQTRGMDMFREKKLIFSLASPAQQNLAFGLGVVNLFALLLVGVRLLNSDELIQLTIRQSGFLAGGALRIVNWMFPLLVVYGVTFLLIPAVRLAYIRHRNKQIDLENDAREMWRRRKESWMV